MEYILQKTQINIVSQKDNELKIYFSVVNAISRQKYAGYQNSRLEPTIK